MFLEEFPMPEFLKKLFPRVESYHGTGFPSQFNLTGKAKIGLTLTICAVVIQIIMMLSIHIGIGREYETDFNEYRSIISIIDRLNSGSALLMADCIKRTIPEDPVIDLLTPWRQYQKQLERKLLAHFDTDRLDSAYKALDQYYVAFSKMTLDPSQYTILKQYYNTYVMELTDLETAVEKFYNSRMRHLGHITGLWILYIFLLLIFMGFATWFIVTAARSIARPAQVIGEGLAKKGHFLNFNFSLPVYSPEGLGITGLLLNDALQKWEQKLTSWRQMLHKFYRMYKELLDEVRIQEISVYQVHEVHHAIHDYLQSQNRSLNEMSRHIAKLSSYLSSLQHLPYQLQQIEEQVRYLLMITKTQIDEGLLQPVEHIDLSDMIRDLFSNVQTISTRAQEVSAVYRDVAEQTELLAFNTAIEAAKAGFEGLGFTVVSNEIARLVERSRTATVDLHTVLASLLEKTEPIQKNLSESVLTKEVSIELRAAVATICGELLQNISESMACLNQLKNIYETLIRKNRELQGEVEKITALTTDMEPLKFIDVEILDYQLNIKEAIRTSENIAERTHSLQQKYPLSPPDVA